MERIFDPEAELELEITNTKKYKIDINPKSAKFLIMNLIKDDYIEFSMYIIKTYKSKLYKKKFDYSTLLTQLEIDDTNYVDIKSIFNYCNEFLEKNTNSINFIEEKKLLILKQLNENQECYFTLEEENKNKNIDEESIKILLEELNKKNEGSTMQNNNNNKNENYKINQINKICSQMKKSVCGIKKNNGSIWGNGFFMKTKNKQNNFIYLLITSNNIINEQDINNEINLGIILNNDFQNEKNIKLKNNLKYYIDNNEKGISIIEINKSQYKSLNNIEYLELDEKIFENSSKEKQNKETLNKIYNNESIYTIKYPKENEEVEISYGILEKIDNENNINHKCFTKNITPGSPILLSKNNSLIGIHINNNDILSKFLFFDLLEFMEKYKKNFEEKDLVNEIILDEVASNKNKNNDKNSMYIEYNIPNNKLEIHIFGELFVKNNREKCIIKYENQNFDLSRFFPLGDRKNDKILKVILEEKENNIVTDMSFMFIQCNLLKSVDISNWNTKNVINMSNMFSDCINLKNIKGISNLITNNVENMSSMFYKCYSLIPFPDISSWNTEKLKDISKMFSECKSLPNKPSNWNLISLKNMKNLFSKNQITEINFISNWQNLSSVIDMSYLFNECNNLNKMPDLSKWDISSVEDISGLFKDCKNLIQIKGIEKWNVGKVKNMSNLFNGCEKLKSICDISKWNISSVTDLSYIFNDCKMLEYMPDISKWDISNVENISHIFCNCINLSPIPDISRWNTIKVKDMSNIFKNCKNISSIPDISKWNTSNVENMGGIFYQCETLSILPDISKWKTSNVTSMFGMFCSCRSLRSLPDISKWDFKNVKNMGKFCYKCKSLDKLPNGLLKLNFKNVEYKEYAFDGCKFKIPSNFLAQGDCIIY